MTKDDFKKFAEGSLEAVIQFAEGKTGKILPRQIAFQWFSQKSEPIREGIVEHIVDKVFIDEEHIYPVVDIGVWDILADGTPVIFAIIAGYEPRPFGKNWNGKDGLFIHVISQNAIDKLSHN